MRFKILTLPSFVYSFLACIIFFFLVFRSFFKLFLSIPALFYLVLPCCISKVSN